MILYVVVTLGNLGTIVHIYFSDTDVFMLALLSNSSLCTMFWVMSRQAALPGIHSLTLDTSRGKCKPTYFKTFMKPPDDVISTLGGLDVGAYLSDQVLCGYEQFLCQLFNLTAVMAMQVRWHMLTQLKQGVEKVFRTLGVIIQYIL